MPQTAEAIIIGAGVMGASLAFHLTRAGMRNVLVLDFKSLYPSIIRTFNIDPYAFWVAEHQLLDDAAVVPTPAEPNGR